MIIYVYTIHIHIPICKRTYESIKIIKQKKDTSHKCAII